MDSNLGIVQLNNLKWSKQLCSVPAAQWGFLREPLLPPPRKHQASVKSCGTARLLNGVEGK